MARKYKKEKKAVERELQQVQAELVEKEEELSKSTNNLTCVKFVFVESHFRL